MKKVKKVVLVVVTLSYTNHSKIKLRNLLIRVLLSQESQFIKDK
jgi:hypothetical protein